MFLMGKSHRSGAGRISSPDNVGGQPMGPLAWGVGLLGGWDQIRSTWNTPRNWTSFGDVILIFVSCHVVF